MNTPDKCNKCVCDHALKNVSSDGFCTRLECDCYCQPGKGGRIFGERIVDISQLRAAVRERNELVQLLLAVEWTTDHVSNDAHCPMCWNAEAHGHMPDCRLGLAVKAAGFEGVKFAEVQE